MTLVPIILGADGTTEGAEARAGGTVEEVRSRLGTMEERAKEV
jgi:hypothetical protein